MFNAVRSSELNISRTSTIEAPQPLRYKDAEIIVDTMFDSMMECLAQGERIEIRGFGSFAVKHRATREGRNPKTVEALHIPVKRMPHIRIGKELCGRINPTVHE